MMTAIRKERVKPLPHRQWHGHTGKNCLHTGKNCLLPLSEALLGLTTSQPIHEFHKITGIRLLMMQICTLLEPRARIVCSCVSSFVSAGKPSHGFRNITGIVRLMMQVSRSALESKVVMKMWVYSSWAFSTITSDPMFCQLSKHRACATTGVSVPLFSQQHSLAKSAKSVPQ